MRTSQFFATLHDNRSIADELKAASIDADLARWTSLLTTAVVRSCEQLGWTAAGRGHRCSVLPVGRNEYLSQDVMVFDLHVRDSLSRVTYQFPEDIADGVRQCSSVELWNALALQNGATPVNKTAVAKRMKTDLSLIVRRRNGIAHEGDLQQSPPREPLPISRADLVIVRDYIEQVVRAIDAVVV